MERRVSSTLALHLKAPRNDAFGPISDQPIAFVCTAALAILSSIDETVSRDLLGGWLSERQLPSGGLNGRPEKLEDVCYSFWDLSALAILGRMGWIDQERLIHFILSTQVRQAFPAHKTLDMPADRSHFTGPRRRRLF